MNYGIVEGKKFQFDHLIPFYLEGKLQFLRYIKGQKSTLWRLLEFPYESRSILTFFPGDIDIVK